MIPEMNTSTKAMEWLFCFSKVNLMFGCLLFKKINESCSLSKAARMSSTYLIIKFRFVKVIFIKPLRFVKAHEDVSKDRS